MMPKPPTTDQIMTALLTGQSIEAQRTPLKAETTDRELGVWQRQERLMSALAESLERFAAALAEQIAPLTAWMKKWSADLKEADQPSPRLGKAYSVPCALHAALAMNVRTAPRLTLRPVRSPATRRY